MANEITIQMRVTRKDPGNPKNSHVFEFPTTSFDQSVDRHNDLIKNIGTSEESVTFTDVTANGILSLHNLDPTNYVEWGTATGDYTGRLKSGEPAILRLNTGKTLYLMSNTAACDVRICLYAD